MQPLFTAADSEFDSVRFVLIDMDETLTYQGRLAAATYTALERLQAYGIRVIPVTAAPAGWCDQMARMWPVDGVIGENGGLFFQRAVGGHELRRHFWHSETEEELVTYRLLYGDYGLWVRPRAMFVGTIEIDGRVQPRFAYIGPA